MPSDVLEQPQPELAAQAAGRPILIIEDDASIADVLSIRLQQQGFSAIRAGAGRAGLELARGRKPSLVLLDLCLPDIDGFTVCQELADDPATCDIPVIILSALDQPDIIRRCRAVGGCYYLRKPYDPNALLILIQQALDQASDFPLP